MSICVTELKPNDREQGRYVTQLHEPVLLYFLSKPRNSERQKLSNSPEHYLILLLVMSQELCFNSLQKGFLTPGQQKTSKKRGRHQNNLEKIRSTKQTEKWEVPCPWQGVASGGSLRFLNQTLPGFCDPHQLWPQPWAPASRRRVCFGEGSHGESQRGSEHMANDQVRLWFPKSTLFPMKHHFLPFQIQNYEEKQGFIFLGKSCKLRIWKVGIWTSLPSWFHLLHSSA